MVRDALIEVIVCSVSDAVEAEQGGAGRLEIIREFARGGLTPSYELVTQILARVALPVRVMLRESDGYGVAGERERQDLCRAAQQFSQLPIDGFVLGFLRENQIDAHLTEQIIGLAPGIKATFHHAFEETSQLRAIQEIKKFKQVDRILAHGGSGSWPDKIKRLVTYREEAQPEIQIVVGGGLDVAKIKELSETTDLCEFHVGRSARVSGTLDGPVQAVRVKEIVAAAKQR
jgi:copper homeostasis protein